MVVPRAAAGYARQLKRILQPLITYGIITIIKIKNTVCV